jgi:general secretion pathway protein G
MKTNKSAFTLIELLVVIAIIGLLATLAVISLNNARAKSRDAKRVADVKQIQTALELYYNDKGHYPSASEYNSGSIFSTSTSGTTTYMAIIPVAPQQLDGACTSGQNNFVYNSTDGSSYTISFCTGGTVGSLAAGPKCVMPSGIQNIDCSGAGGMLVSDYGTETASVGNTSAQT